jgi:hypothetical protein
MNDMNKQHDACMFHTFSHELIGVRNKELLQYQVQIELAEASSFQTSHTHSSLQC